MMREVVCEESVDAWGVGEERCFFDGVEGPAPSSDGLGRLESEAVPFDGDKKSIRLVVGGLPIDWLVEVCGEVDVDVVSGPASLWNLQVWGMMMKM